MVEASFFLVVAVGKTMHKSYTLQFGRVRVCIRKNCFTWRVWQQGNRLPREVVSLSLEVSKTQLDKSRANLTQHGDWFCCEREGGMLEQTSSCHS